MEMTKNECLRCDWTGNDQCKTVADVLFEVRPETKISMNVVESYIFYPSISIFLKETE